MNHLVLETSKTTMPPRTKILRSECLTCTFRASCCSARLSQVQVPSPVPLSGTEKKRREGVRGGGGLPALADTREYEQSDRNR